MSEKKYYSRSPEEWKKIDEEKRRAYLQRSQQLRRRAYTFLLINLFVVVVIILGYFIFKSFPRPQQSYIAFSGSLSFQLIMGKSEDYYPDEAIDVKIKAINDSKKTVALKIKGFSMKIFSETNDIVYKFNYNGTVEKNIESYQSVLIFSLKHERELKLSPGTYRIDTEIILDKKNIRLQRTFNVKEDIFISLSSKDDFFFPGEDSIISIYFTNHSLYNGVLQLNSMKFSIDSKFLDIPMEKKIFSISEGERVKIIDIKFKAPKEKGAHPVKVETTFLMGKEIRNFSAQKNIVVASKDDLSSLKNLRIITDSVIVTPIGSEIKFKVFLANDSSKDKFLILNRFFLQISKASVDFYKYDISQSFKLMVSAYSKRMIFDTESWQKLIFNEEGKYNVEIVVYTNKGVIKHNYQILVH